MHTCIYPEVDAPSEMLPVLSHVQEQLFRKVTMKFNQAKAEHDG